MTKIYIYRKHNHGETCTMMYIQTYCSSPNKQNAKDDQCRLVKINKVTKGHIFGKKQSRTIQKYTV